MSIDWPNRPDLDRTLTAHWLAGLSTVAIGRAMGITKNAVVGRARRLGLPPRPSPIRHEKSKPDVPRYRKVSLPRLPSLKQAEAAVPKVTQMVKPVLVRPPPAPREGPVVPCAWVIGETRGRFGDVRIRYGKDWHYCEVPSEPGRPYCPKHTAIAFNHVAVDEAAD